SESRSHMHSQSIPTRRSSDLGLKNSQASKLAHGIGDQFNVDVVGWFPFSEEVQRSLSRSVFILTERRHSMTAKFQELARQVNTEDRKSTRLNSSHGSNSYAVL